MQNVGLMRRIGAMIYDGFLCLACLAVLAMLATVPLGFERVQTGSPTYQAAYNILRALIPFLFFTLYWWKAGMTLGMQSLRLKLETLDGNHATFAAVTVRFFAALISWLPAGLGFLWQLWDREKLTWHDRISKTRIVYYPKASTPEGS